MRANHRNCRAHCPKIHVIPHLVDRTPNAPCSATDLPSVLAYPALLKAPTQFVAALSLRTHATRTHVDKMLYATLIVTQCVIVPSIPLAIPIGAVCNRSLRLSYVSLVHAAEMLTVTWQIAVRSAIAALVSSAIHTLAVERFPGQCVSQIHVDQVPNAL